MPEFHERKDPVDRLVADMTPEETADWLIKYHGAYEESRSTIANNLRTQFYAHELRGRLWRGTLASVLSGLFIYLLDRKHKHVDTDVKPVPET